MTSFQTAKCKYGQQATQYCSSSVCNQSPGVCGVQGCLCPSHHAKCPVFVSAKAFITKLMEPAPEAMLYCQIVEEILDNMVSKLTDLATRFRRYKNRACSNDIQKEILGIIKTQEFQKLTPSLVKSLMTEQPSRAQLLESELFRQVVRRVNDDFGSLSADIETLILDGATSKFSSLSYRKTCLQTLKFQSGRNIDYLQLRSTETNMVFNRMDTHILKYDNIYYLQLRSLGLGVTDIQSIGKALINLTTLDLCECQIDNSTASELANYFPKLNTLWLRKNNVEDEGALAIANRLTSLTYLNLARNSISEETKQIVRQKLPKAKVCV